MPVFLEMVKNKVEDKSFKEKIVKEGLSTL